MIEERTGIITFQGNPLTLIGKGVSVGEAAPEFCVLANDLTPRTLDIDRVQELMPKYGIEPKILIEGPPRREVPILLRQTSFKALEEAVLFAGEHKGTHTARFGEIEQRRKDASCTTVC